MPRLSRLLALAGTIVFLGAIMGASMFGGTASASQITSRSLTLQAGVTDGGSKPSGVVNHLFTFSIPSATTIGSIQFEYCTIAYSPTNACTTPAGLDTTAATLGSQSGAATGFTLDNTTNGAPYLTRTSATITPGAASYQLLGVTNPDGTDCPALQQPACTFFVRISTFASIDTTGSATDTGTVAAAVTRQIVLNGTMPESLVFCTGATVLTTSSVPDCATATDASDIEFNQLFSPTDTATATSQMAASTNAGGGYSITVNGPTMTSGSNTITAVTGSPFTSTKGISQFGMNLKANTVATSNPAVGIEVAPAANGTNYRGEAVGAYATVDNFKFITGDGVADSAFGGAGGTDAQIYTVSYIVNVPGSQPAGTYTTTLTYICTPTF